MVISMISFMSETHFYKFAKSIHFVKKIGSETLTSIRITLKIVMPSVTSRVIVQKKKKKGVLKMEFMSTLIFVVVVVLFQPLKLCTCIAILK